MVWHRAWSWLTKAADYNNAVKLCHDLLIQHAQRTRPDEWLLAAIRVTLFWTEPDLRPAAHTRVLKYSFSETICIKNISISISSSHINYPHDTSRLHIFWITRASFPEVPRHVPHYSRDWGEKGEVQEVKVRDSSREMTQMFTVWSSQVKFLHQRKLGPEGTFFVYIFLSDENKYECKLALHIQYKLWCNEPLQLQYIQLYLFTECMVGKQCLLQTDHCNNRTQSTITLL